GFAFLERLELFLQLVLIQVSHRCQLDVRVSEERVRGRPGPEAAAADEADLDGAVLSGKQAGREGQAAGDGRGGEKVATRRFGFRIHARWLRRRGEARAGGKIIVGGRDGIVSGK